MADDITSLAKVRADRSGDCRDWTPRDALVEMLRRIDAGEIEVETIYVAATIRIDERRIDQVWQCAGGTKAELLGLLARHMHLVNSDADKG